MKLYEYLEENYEVNEPIFLYDVDVEGMSKNAVKLEMKKLQDENKIRKYDRGIYYFPSVGPLGLEKNPGIEKIIDKKYFQDDSGNIIGYYTDTLFANYLRLTTQRPLSFIIRTNKATKEKEEKTIGGFRIILKRPRCTVDSQNYKLLQLLDLFADANYFVEDDFENEFKDKVQEYMKAENITMNDLKNYYQFYPVRIYKNMYERGLLNEAFK